MISCGCTPERRATQFLTEAAVPSFALTVNGGAQTVEVRDPNEPFLYVLRNSLGLTGAKYGCGLGQCGACMVLVDGEATPSCLLPVSKAAGRKITTVEGLGSPAKPHPLQAAFIAEQAAQCGYCATGMVMTGAALLAKKPNATLQEAKEALAGNLCRCGTHQRILRAMMRAAGRGHGMSAAGPPQDANCSPSGGSVAAAAASVGAHQ
jgi:nicotinate dehydrogenase subunit A